MQLFLGGSYADIGNSSETAFTVATAIVAFTFASTLAVIFWPGEQDWKEPLPDQPAESARRR